MTEEQAFYENQILGLQDEVERLRKLVKRQGPPDEPIFILRAQDMMAPALVQLWISINPQISVEKRMEAQEILEAMRKWKFKKLAD